MAILDSDEGSLLDTFLLYLYQTIVLAALVAVGFIVYLLRTRAPLKEPEKVQTDASQKVTNGTVSEGNDENTLKACLLDEGPRSIACPPSQANRYPKAEEEEEEDEGPVMTRKPPVRQFMVLGQNASHSGPAAPSENGAYHEEQQPGFSDAMKFEARKRVSQAVQKKQLLELVAEGEFDQAITNIRQASQRLQNEEF